MSAIHLWCESLSLHDSPMTLTERFVNSGSYLDTVPSSVVHTGVKSAGWLERRVSQNEHAAQRAAHVRRPANCATVSVPAYLPVRHGTRRTRERAKERACLNITTQLVPAHSWNLMGPLEVSACANS